MKKLNRRQKKITRILARALPSAREIFDRMVYVFKMTGQTTQNFKKNFERAMEKHRAEISRENPDPEEYVAKLIASETEEERKKRREEIRAWLERERQASLRRSRQNNFLIVILILIIFLLLLSL